LALALLQRVFLEVALVVVAPVVAPQLLLQVVVRGQRLVPLLGRQVQLQLLLQVEAVFLEQSFLVAVLELALLKFSVGFLSFCGID
jgi:hypothetical protein